MVGQGAETARKQVDMDAAPGPTIHIEQEEYADSDVDEDSHMHSGRDSEAGCSTPSIRSTGAPSLAPSTVSCHHTCQPRS